MPDGAFVAPEAVRVAPPVVRLRGVSRRFGAVQALDDVEFEVAAGEVLGIIGRSGAGKSTLIRCLNGLERPDRGTVEIDGQDVTALDERGLRRLRRRVGMVFQHFNLLSARTVAQNVALPLRIDGWGRATRSRRVGELLELVGLAGKADAYPAQLSGGQKQRVGIARALAAEPNLLLCDEATSALDPETTRSILALLREVNRRLGLTIVLITHEMEVVRAIADRVVVLDHGRVAEQGRVWEVFAQPRAAVTRSLLQTLRPEVPARIATALHPVRRPGEATVLRLDLHGEQAKAPVLADLAATQGVHATLLQGGVTDVQGEPVGVLFVSVEADDDALARTLAFLAPRVSASEVLGHVALPR